MANSQQLMSPLAFIAYSCNLFAVTLNKFHLINQHPLLANYILSTASMAFNQGRLKNSPQCSGLSRDQAGCAVQCGHTFIKWVCSSRAIETTAGPFSSLGQKGSGPSRLNVIVLAQGCVQCLLPINLKGSLSAPDSAVCSRQVQPNGCVQLFRMCFYNGELKGLPIFCVLYQTFLLKWMNFRYNLRIRLFICSLDVESHFYRVK